jgi:transcriptional regulator with XRE-family HTH domain
MTMQRWTWSRAGWVPVGTSPASLPAASTRETVETDKPAGWFRRLRRRREILGLTVAEAALLTGVSPRTLTRAEIDDDYTPSAVTARKLAWQFGEDWDQPGFQIVSVDDEAQRKANALHWVQRRLHAIRSVAYRRKAVGVRKAATLACLGQPLPYLMATRLLPHRTAEMVCESMVSLSADDERELGFPERRFGQVVQRTSGVEQTLNRALLAYVTADRTDVSAVRATLQRAWDAWDAVRDEVVPEELTAIAASFDCTPAEITHELQLHRVGWDSVGGDLDAWYQRRVQQLRDRQADAEQLQALATAYQQRRGEHERYRTLFGRSPSLSGALWESLGEGERDATWEARKSQWQLATHRPVMSDEDGVSRPVTVDELLAWTQTLPAEFVQELLDVTPAEVEAVSVDPSRASLVARLQRAAHWACVEAAQGKGLAWTRFLRAVVTLCHGPRGAERRRLAGKVWGHALDPRTLAEHLPLREIFQAALVPFQQQSARAHQLWQAVHACIAQPFRRPADLPDDERLAHAVLSLLPSPPVARSVMMTPEEAQAVLTALAPPLFPDVPQPTERVRRLVMGALKQWYVTHRELPLVVCAQRRRALLLQATKAVLAGTPETEGETPAVTTARKFARAVLQTLPQPILTGVALPSALAQERVVKGLPYFFPYREAGHDHLAAVLETARAVVLRAVAMHRTTL